MTWTCCTYHYILDPKMNLLTNKQTGADSNEKVVAVLKDIMPALFSTKGT